MVTFVGPFAMKDAFFIPQTHWLFKLHHGLNLIATAGVFTEHTFDYQARYLHGQSWPRGLAARWAAHKFQFTCALYLIVESLNIAKYSHPLGGGNGFDAAHKWKHAAVTGLFLVAPLPDLPEPDRVIGALC